MVAIPLMIARDDIHITMLDGTKKRLNFIDEVVSTLGLNGHAYTKVPAFLDATADTNLKRNISIFMYNDGGKWKIDRNDSFPYTLEQIYDVVRADKSGNTGIIAVVQNEDMAAYVIRHE